MKTHWSPNPKSPRMGQIADVITGSVARNIVDKAEPVARRIITEERTRYAEAFLEGLPWALGAAVAFIGTAYLVPAKSIPKTAGYVASAALMGTGIWMTLDDLIPTSGTVTPTAQAPSNPSSAQGIAEQAAQAIVVQAEPKIRQIVAEERTRAISALETGLPLYIAAIADFFVTMLVIDDKNKTLKALGYTSSAALLGIGAWMSLEREKAA